MCWQSEHLSRVGHIDRRVETAGIERIREPPLFRTSPAPSDESGYPSIATARNSSDQSVPRRSIADEEEETRGSAFRTRPVAARSPYRPVLVGKCGCWFSADTETLVILPRVPRSTGGRFFGSNWRRRAVGSTRDRGALRRVRDSKRDAGRLRRGCRERSRDGGWGGFSEGGPEHGKRAFGRAEGRGWLAVGRRPAAVLGFWGLAALDPRHPIADGDPQHGKTATR